MIIFSEITCRANTTDFVSRGLVSGEPICYGDLIDWTVFRNFLQECRADSKITVEVRAYGYGEDDGFGKWDATPEEIAYMNMRAGQNERFFETRCHKIRPMYRVEIDLSAWATTELSKVVREN